MAAVVPWLLTAPLSLLYTLLPDGSLSGTHTGLFTVLYLAGIAVAALANAAFMGHAVRRLRQPFPGTAPGARPSAGQSSSAKVRLRSAISRRARAASDGVQPRLPSM